MTPEESFQINAEDFQELVDKCLRYETALKKYADEIFYDHPSYILTSNPPQSPNWIMKDRGKLAREALRGKEWK